MSRRRKGPEDGFRYVLDSQLDEALAGLDEQGRQIVLAFTVYGTPTRVIGQHFGFSVEETESIIRASLARLRHPKRFAIRDEVREETDPFIFVSPELRAILHRLPEQLHGLACQVCDIRTPWWEVEPAATGRPRKYCSDACRQKAYRRRVTGKGPTAPGRSKPS